MFRRSMIKGWWFLIRHPRQWKRTESVGGQDLFIVGNNKHEHEPITKRISYSRQLGSEKSRQHSPDDDDNDSIEEIQPMPQSHNTHGRQMYEMNHISPVSPISPILANSNFGSSTAVNETNSHAAALRSHAPGILPDTGSGKKPTAYPGQNGWSDSTSGMPSFSHEAGNVSRRHETTNLFFDAPDEHEVEAETGRTRNNKKLDNML